MGMQELIHLPTLGSFRAEAQVHEASRTKVEPGMPVRITVDALPGRNFFGRVAVVAPLPNAQMSFMNPDLKVYDMDIYFEGDVEGLRTGMSCMAEIVVEDLEEATFVPVQSIVLASGQHTAYVIENGELVARPVTIGQDNNRMIHILEGLKSGETVSLTPPLTETEKEDEFELDARFSERKPPEVKASPAGGPGGGEHQGGPGGPGGGGGRFSEADREKLRNMSDEEKKAFFEKMGITPRAGGGGGGRPGGGGDGGRPGGGGDGPQNP